MGLYIRRTFHEAERREAERKEVERAQARELAACNRAAKQHAVEELTAIRLIRKGELEPPVSPGPDFQAPVYDRLKRYWKAHPKQEALETSNTTDDTFITQEDSHETPHERVRPSDSSVIWSTNQRKWLTAANYQRELESSKDRSASPSPQAAKKPANHPPPAAKAKASETSRVSEIEKTESRSPRGQVRPGTVPEEKFAEKSSSSQDGHASKSAETPTPGLARRDTGGSIIQTLQRISTGLISKMCS